MPWEEKTVNDQRAEFVARAILGEESMSALCREFGISRPTGYKWVERFRSGEGLCDRSHAPFSRPFRTDPGTEQRIVDARAEHPTWGARKLQRYLTDKDNGGTVPAASTINDILKRSGLVSEAATAQHTPWRRFEMAAPNDLWQMDYKGHFGLLDGSRCHALTLLDDHARFSLGLDAKENERWAGTMASLVRIFREFGLPRAILCDNGAPWSDNQGGYTPFEIANAEFVIEGELLPDRTVSEDSTTGSGFAIPEFAGYASAARVQPVLKVRAVTCRHKPIFQVCIGASEEHVTMSGLPTEAALLAQLDRAMPGKVVNAYCPPSGGGKLNGILQFRKSVPQDEGKQRQAALLALGTAPEMKNLVLVDDDVDIFDPYDVEWALTTRFRPDKDLVTIPGVRCHIGDPTQKKFFDPDLWDNGIAYKAIYDATVPFPLRDKFVRAEYQEVDEAKWGDIL